MQEKMLLVKWALGWKDGFACKAVFKQPDTFEIFDSKQRFQRFRRTFKKLAKDARSVSIRIKVLRKVLIRNPKF